MKYYYLLVFVFLFANVFAQNSDDTEVVSTGIDDFDADEALYNNVETLRQFCNYVLKENDTDVKNFNLNLCEVLARFNGGDIAGANQTAMATFADKTLPDTQKKEIMKNNVQVMKQIRESILASKNNNTSNNNDAGNSNGASNSNAAGNSNGASNGNNAGNSNAASNSNNAGNSNGASNNNGGQN